MSATGGRLLRSWFVGFLAVVCASCAHSGMLGERRVLPLRVFPLFSISMLGLVRVDRTILNPAPEDHALMMCCEWGDGRKSCSSDAELQENRLTFACSHRYEVPGNYTIRVTLKRDDREVSWGQNRLWVRGTLR